MEDEDVIRSQMEGTRTSLSEKLGNLEQQVVSTVQGATSAVAQTVEAVKESVQETVGSMKDTVQSTMSSVKDTMQGGVEAVRDAFDISAHVQNYPWIMMGGATAVGYVLGSLFGSKSTAMTAGMTQASNYDTGRSESSRGSSRGVQHSSNGGQRRKSESQDSGPSFLAGMAPEISKLKGLALGALMGTVREMVLKAVPEHMGTQLRDVINSLTEKVGGDPIPSSDWDFSQKEQQEAQPSHAGQDQRPLGGRGY